MDYVQNAIDALNDLFADTSVPLEITADRLKEVRDEIDLLLNTLERDLVVG